MKKIFALVLTFALTLCTLATLTSCGGGAFDENKNISVVTREDGSGTKSAFMEIIGLKGKTDEIAPSRFSHSISSSVLRYSSGALQIKHSSFIYVTPC